MDTSQDALLDALFSQHDVGVGVCGGDGRLQEFNSALESIMGPARPDCSQRDWAPAYHLYDASGRRPLRSDEIPLVRALAGEIVVDAAITMRRPDHPVRHLRCTAAPLHEGEQAGGALVLVTEVTEVAGDVTATATSAADLARFRLRMSHLQELSVQVASFANHQIRTPLSVIQAHLELLEDGVDDLPEEARRAIPAIRRGVASLTDALAALTRANDLADAADPTMVAIDLVDVARRATMLVRAGHPTLRVDLTTGAKPHLPAQADPMWVRRAIVALTNALIGPDVDTDMAIEVLDRGDTVGVRLTRFEACADVPAHLAMRWTPRADSTTSPRGLEFALAQVVALAHDGSLEIAETPTGMSATLLLPRVPHTSA
jgi:light-regulated signal transduction histidine kinase (bacteriophytochrome)